MSRLVALCLVAYLAFGFTVGCTADGGYGTARPGRVVHRAWRISTRPHPKRRGRELAEEFCACGHRVAFEVCPPG